MEVWVGGGGGGGGVKRKERDRQTDRQRQRQRDKDRDRKTQRETKTDRQRQRQRDRDRKTDRQRQRETKSHREVVNEEEGEEREGKPRYSVDYTFYSVMRGKKPKTPARLTLNLVMRDMPLLGDGSCVSGTRRYDMNVILPLGPSWSCCNKHTSDFIH